MDAAQHSLGFRRWFNRRGWIKITIATPYVWLSLFFLLPFVIVIAMSFATRTPTAPPFSFGGDHPVMNTNHYARLFSDDLYIRAYLNSIGNATLATLMCLLIGYPMALGLTRVSRSWRNVLLMLVILPFWTSFLLRVYAWIGILKNNGLINNTLMALGVIDQPIQMLQTDFAVYVGIVYSYLPFMILPLYANLEKMDLTLLEAAADLGSRPWESFLKVTLPLSVPGIIAGCLLVFIPAVGEFVIPALLGDPGTLMIGKVLWTEFFNNRDWPVASAVAIALLLFLVIPIMYFQRAQDAEAGGVHR
jgi:putrescine transport system permease protein